MVQYKHFYPVTELIMSIIGHELHIAVESGDLEKISSLINELSSDEICSVNLNNQSILDIAIEKQYLLVVENIIRLLKKKDKNLLKLLLLTNPSKRERELPIIKAAKIKDAGICDLLIQQPVGYSFETLERVKKERGEINTKERQWWKFGAFIESACPSKALADLVNSPMLVGGGFISGAILLFSLTMIFGSLSLVGLVFIAYANYQKKIAEENIEKEALAVVIQSAQLDNLVIQIKQLLIKSQRLELFLPEEQDEFIEQIKVLKNELDYLSIIKKNNTTIKEAKKTYIGKEKKIYDYLTPKDKTLGTIISMGKILCASAGILAVIGVLLTTSAAIPVISIVVFASVAIAVSLYYISINQQQYKELGEQRKSQYLNKLTLYKKLLDIEHGSILINAHKALKTHDANYQYSFEAFDLFYKSKDQISEKKKQFALLKKNIEGIDEEKKYHYLLAAAECGDIKLFKQLICLGVTNNKPKTQEIRTTALHLAVQNGYFLLIEEMLGISIAASTRENKKNWACNSDDIEEQSAFKQKQILRKQKLISYKNLSKETKELLLTYDSKGMLPLYYAAALQDPSLYNLLQKQAVGYSKSQLDKAQEIREKTAENEKIWLLTHAVITAICPAASIGEIAHSFAFSGLIIGAGAGLSLGISLSFIPVFLFVIYGNYYKEKVERGLLNEMEQVAVNHAFAKNIELRVIHLSKSEIPLTQKEFEELATIQLFINAHRILEHKGKSATSIDFVHYSEKIQAIGVSIGAFLCAYSGILGLLSLIGSLYVTGSAATAVSASVLSILTVSGPVGWAILIGCALIGVIIASTLAYFYYQQRESELRVFGVKRKEIYTKEHSLAVNINQLKNNTSTIELLEKMLEKKPRLNDLCLNNIDRIDLSAGTNDKQVTAKSYWIKPGFSIFSHRHVKNECDTNALQQVNTYGKGCSITSSL